jgi:hypothetical protein
MNFDMSDFRIEALPLSDTEIGFKEPATDTSGFIPDPWMIRAYFEDPKALPSKIKKSLAGYVKAHPLIERAYQEDRLRSKTQDDALRSLFSQA